MVRNPVWAAETGAVSHSPAHKTRSWGEKREIHVNVRQIDAFYKKKCFKNTEQENQNHQRGFAPLWGRRETLYGVLDSVYTRINQNIWLLCSIMKRSTLNSIWVNWRSQDVKSWFKSALKTNCVVLCLDFALRWHFTGLKRQ